MTKTHFLNFKIPGHPSKMVKCSEEYFNEKMIFFLRNPTYAEKLNEVIDAREQVGMVFTMANFNGEGGILKKQSKIVYEIAPPELSEEEIKDRAKRLRAIGNKHLGPDWQKKAIQSRKKDQAIRERDLKMDVQADRKNNLGQTGFKKF